MNRPHNTDEPEWLRKAKAEARAGVVASLREDRSDFMYRRPRKRKKRNRKRGKRN